MSGFWAHFPFSDQPRRFAAVLGVCGALGAGALTVGAILLPIPRTPAGPLPPDALLALAVPADAPLEAGARILREQFPRESAALTDYIESHAAVSAAAVGHGSATLIILPNSASGTARFLLELPPPGPREGIVSALAKTFPATRPIRLPGEARAEEIVEDQQLIAVRLERHPGTDWLVFVDGSGTVAFRGDERAFSMTNVHPTEMLSRDWVSPSRTACLDGAPTVFPFRLPSRWKIADFTGFIYPILFPITTLTIEVSESTVFLRNFCISIPQ